VGNSTVAQHVHSMSMSVSHNLGGVHARMVTLRTICTRLFEKLQDTAQFLQTLLDALGETEEGKELVRKIREMHLDLDKSMHEAHSIVKEVKNAEDSIAEFREILENTFEAGQNRTRHASFFLENSFAKRDQENKNKEIAELQEKVSQLEHEKHALNGRIGSFRGEIEELRQEKLDLDMQIGELQSQLDEEKSKMEAVAKEKRNLNARINGLQTQLDDEKVTTEAMNNEIKELEKKVNRLRQEKLDLDKPTMIFKRSCRRLRSATPNWHPLSRRATRISKGRSPKVLRFPASMKLLWLNGGLSSILMSREMRSPTSTSLQSSSMTARPARTRSYSY